MLQQGSQIRPQPASTKALVAERRDHPTLPTCQAAPGVPCLVLVPTVQEGHGQTGEDPNKGHEMIKVLDNMLYEERLRS